MLNKTNLSAIFGLVAVALLLQCKSTIVMKSVWLKDKVTIDGDFSEWKGLLQTPSDLFAIGIGNDDSSLYICLHSEDRGMVHQVMKYGLTLWFENGKSAKNRVGIRFPMGRTGGRGVRRFQEARPDSEALQRLREESLTTMEVLGPGKNDTIPMTISVAQSWGRLALKATSDMEQFTYELKIPLHADSTAKIATPISRDSLIMVVLESVVPEQNGAESNEEHGEESGRGFGGGGGGHGGGGHGGGGGGHMGGRHGGGFSGRHSEASNPFSTKFSVKLANGRD